MIVQSQRAVIQPRFRPCPLKAKFAELSFVPAKSNPEQFKKLIREDLSKIGQAVKEANIKID